MIVVREKFIEEIPVLETYEAGVAGKRPVILVLHGFGTGKEYHLFEMYKFAMEGYFVVSFDAFGHGGHLQKNFQKADLREKALHLQETILETVGYINRIICFYSGSDCADIGKIGLYGFSMGGCIIFKYLCDSIDARIKAAVTVCSTPVWGSMYERLMEATSVGNQKLREIKVKGLEGIEPYPGLGTITDFPLLMINTRDDQKIPIEDVKSCYRFLKENYNDKERIKMVVYKGAEHLVLPAMADNAAAWMNTNVRCN